MPSTVALLFNCFCFFALHLLNCERSGIISHIGWLLSACTFRLWLYFSLSLSASGLAGCKVYNSIIERSSHSIPRANKSPKKCVSDVEVCTASEFLSGGNNHRSLVRLCLTTAFQPFLTHPRCSHQMPTRRLFALKCYVFAGFSFTPISWLRRRSHEALI